MELLNLNRYDRQELIEGWDQQKLKDATISIIGSDVLAQYIALPLTALGVGSIRIIDNERATGEGFLDFELKGGSRAKTLELALERVNPSIDIKSYSSTLVSEGSKYFLQGSDLIIDATNSPRSKTISIEYALEKDIPLFVTSCKPYYGKIMRYKKEDGKDPKYLLHTFEKEYQDEAASIVMGGMITEEVKKTLMGQELLEIPLYYNLLNEDRFTYEQQTEIEELEIGEFSHKTALIIGAGALGNFVAMGLTKMGLRRIDVVDPDVVEDTNLNRQILFYDAVGREKARVLASKIKRMGRGLVKSSAFVNYFHEKTKKSNYDLLFDCVDNFTARAIMNDYALKYKIPLVSGGTSPEAGQVVVYVPGQTACLECTLDIHKLGEEALERARSSCIYAPNASVIMTNQIIGGMMVNEARTILNQDKYGKPFSGSFKYSSNLERRAGQNHIKKKCKCKPKGGLIVLR